MSSTPSSMGLIVPRDVHPSIPERTKQYVLPGMLIVTSMMTSLSVVVTNPILAFSSFAGLQEKSFARLWTLCGGVCAQDTPPSASALLSTCQGLILDVGPGSGHQLFRFSNVNGIKTIYGVEPGTSMHDDLKASAAKAGLEGKYKVIGASAEKHTLIPALVKEGVIKQEGDSPFDEVVCVRVLCGVPNVKETIEGLYSLLKPGGRMVIFEHVVNSADSKMGGSSFSRLLQRIYMGLGWPFWLGGCQLDRDTLAILHEVAKEADGGWEEVKMELMDGWGVIPHISGYLIKKS